MSTAKTQSQTPHLQRFSGEWETKRLQDILDINPQNFSSNTNPAYKFNYISLEQVDSGRLLGYAEEVFQTAPSRAQRILQSGDVLMSTVRPNLMAHLFFHDQVPNAVCSTGFAVLRSKHDLSAPYFIFAQLFSQNVNNQIAKILAGSNYPAINSRDVKLIEIPCPPQICEQRAIAEVLSHVDGLIGALDALIAKKQATMQQLLTGKTRLPRFSGVWSEKPLIDLATITMGQSPSSMYYNQRGDGVPLIQGNADIKDRRTIDRVWTTQGSKYCDLGDLVLTVRAPVGVVAVASKRACLGRGVCGLKPFGDSRFLLYALSHVQVRWQMLEQGSTFTAANSEQIGQFRLCIPENENEQRAIADMFSDMDAEIATLECRRDKTRAIKHGMMQQLLTGRARLLKSE